MLNTITRLFLLRSTILWLALIFGLTGLAQKVSLKHPLTSADREALDQQAYDCLNTMANITFSFNSSDFSDYKNFVPDKPNTLQEVKNLEKELKGNYRDAGIYGKIGSAYKGMFETEKSNEYFEKSLTLAREYLQKEPDSSSAFWALGMAFSNLGRYEEAIEVLEKAAQLKPMDSSEVLTLSMLYVSTGNFSRFRQISDSLIGQHPNDVYYHSFRLMGVYMETMTRMVKQGTLVTAQKLKGKQAEEVLDMRSIEAGWKAAPDNIGMELVYRSARHIAVFMKITICTAGDTAANFRKEIRFRLDEQDRAELNSLLEFYKRCLNDKRVPYAYFLHKGIANANLLLGRYREAIPFLEKTIQYKPLEKSTYQSNASDDYDNLASVYFLLKDTVSHEKTLEQKFRVHPAINPQPQEYLEMARVALRKKDFAAAGKYAAEALRMNPAREEVYVLLATIQVLKRNTAAAQEQLNKLYSINTSNLELYILQGICMLLDNDPDSAYISFKMANSLLERGPYWVKEELIDRFLLVH